MLVKKILLGRKKFFWVKKNLGLEKFGVQKLFGSENFLGQIMFFGSKLLG